MATKKDSDQTLILKDSDEQWRKVFHGEIATTDDDEPMSAQVIRDYLIVRDEAIALNSIAKAEDLNTISEGEARVIYREAREEINRRSKNGKLELFKNYGVGALIGVLCSTTVYFYLTRQENISTTAPQESATDSLNFSDYQVMTFEETPGVLPNMLLIPGGTFNMGCSKGWDDAAGGCRPSEFPPHAVSVKTFEIAQHEVTVGQFRHFIERSEYITDAEKENRGCVHEDLAAPGRPFVMNPELTWSNPGYEQNDSFPVSCVSWHDAQNYISWLNKETNSAYRLPTETEWEYAARGKQSTAYFWGSEASSNQANYDGVNGKDQWKFAAPVGQFPANKFSVQDTSGNLWEWVEDCWHDTYQGAPTDGRAWNDGCTSIGDRTRRGGAWDANTVGIRSANRSPGGENDRSNLYGFRVARDWQKPE
jgi:formylglycine-generating enzyme required for sulfatase activity